MELRVEPSLSGVLFLNQVPLLSLPLALCALLASLLAFPLLSYITSLPTVASNVGDVACACDVTCALVMV